MFFKVLFIMNIRKQLIIWLFKKSQSYYTFWFKSKKKAWGLNKSQLLNLPEHTLGYALGLFLEKNGFEVIPKVERHDAYHVVTGYGTKVEDEIALQYLCYGNGKRSFYLFGVIVLGTILLPEYFSYYHRSYNIGKQCNSFHHYNYKRLLLIDLEEFRAMIFSEHQQSQLHLL